MIRDLRLVERGLRIVERPFSNFVPLDDGRYLKFGGDVARTQEASGDVFPRATQNAFRPTTRVSIGWPSS